ncbi:MAG: orotidine-5'-phosphate decarboxylase [Clostridiales bacterium]|nr:orotidine-5'-phosphate decarboxylase [Clostridiales bacterium]
MEARKRLALALDVGTLDEGKAWVRRLSPFVGVVKVGLELFVAEGPKAVQELHELGVEIFLDLKLHDIPRTVQRAVEQAGRLPVRYLTLHASGGRAMLEAAREGAERVNARLVLLAVTLLTSLGPEDLRELHLGENPGERALLWAHLAREAGIKGLVTSPKEVGLMRRVLGKEAFLVTPGIRRGEPLGDQRRVAGPGEALKSGADLLVVGRPILEALHPEEAAQAILEEMAEAMGVGEG